MNNTPNNQTIQDILAANAAFVESDAATPYRSGKKPIKQLAIVACMDTRLITMLPAALGLKNGEANIIKTAGAEVNEPYGAVMRSLLVAVYELDVKDIMVIAHTECGAQHMSAEEMLPLMRQAGITEEAIQAASDAAKQKDVDFTPWLEGFGDTEQSVRDSVATIKEHPLIPAHVNVQGFIIETQTGELTEVR